jgi:hypothetical protein
MQDSEHKNISDPSYSAADFRAQLTGGRLRWLATVFAIASIGLFVDFLIEGDKAEVYFPIRIKGRAALWTIGIAFVVWATIAFVNWKSWFRRRKDAS